MPPRDKYHSTAYFIRRQPRQRYTDVQQIVRSAWAAITTSGLVIGTPAASDVGTTTLSVQLSDQLGDTATTTVVINVLAVVHHPPVWTLDPIPLGTILVGSNFTFDLSKYANDPDGNPLTFSMVSGPGWLTVSAAGMASGTPAASNVGAFTAVFEAADPYGNATAGGFGTVVMNVNPIIASPLVFTVKAGNTLAANLATPQYVVDPGGYPMTFAATPTEAGWRYRAPGCSI